MWNKGALVVGGVAGAGTSLVQQNGLIISSPYSMYAPDGSINIQTSSPVEITTSNNSSGPISYQAGTAGAPDDNLTVHSGITLNSTGGAVELDAGNNVTVQAGTVIEAAAGITIHASYLQPTLGSAPAATQVSFGNVANTGTITLTNGGSWAALGYSVGGGIYVQSATDPNGNGATFNAASSNPYYTIAAINGATITLKSGQVLTTESNVILDLAPIVPATFLNTDPGTLGAAPAPTEVSFGNIGNDSTISLTNGGSWAALGYSVGGVIYIQSATDPNGNAATFNTANPNAFYTIAAINGATITLKSGQVLTNESNVTLDLAPVITGVKVDLGGSFTAPNLIVQTGGGNDDVEFHPTTLAADTFIDTGAGDDLIHVYGMPSLTSYANYLSNNGGFADTVNLDGQDGNDTYVIDATAATNYVINVDDTGTPDSGTNSLIINGAATDTGQTFLVRDLFVAILDSNGLPVYQRINYNDTITDRLTINGGDVDTTNLKVTNYGDSFYLDGNSAVTTINAGNGDDFFQVGQVYSGAKRAIERRRATSQAALIGALSNDHVTTTQTTVGWLSEGVDKSTVIYGGAGTDTFQVYSNKADLALIGGSGDDTFIVRAFLVAAGTHIGVQGGSGNDTIEYNIDAPVDIEGGTGFNTLVLLGTEANDTFVITDHGIFGGGLNVSYTNIQAVTIDGLEGDDTFYVLSTPQNVVTTLNGGSGGDTFVVGGDVTGAVISASTNGASSVNDHTVTSNDPSSPYNNIFVAGHQCRGRWLRTRRHHRPAVAVDCACERSDFDHELHGQRAGSDLANGEIAYVNMYADAAVGGIGRRRRGRAAGLDRQRQHLDVQRHAQIRGRHEFDRHRAAARCRRAGRRHLYARRDDRRRQHDQERRRQRDRR